MRVLIFSFFFGLSAILLPLQPAMGEESLAELQATNRLLRAEHELARTAQLYFLFDLGEKPRIEFKGSGVPLAELQVLQARVWGRRPEAKVRTLAAKDTLFPPKRQKTIFVGEGKLEEEKPAKAETKTDGLPELQALELNDMPTFFHARLDDGTLLTFHPAPENLSSRLLELSRGIYWYLSRPLISDWHFLQGKPYTEVRLILPARDVRLLYWSLTEGSSLLIYQRP